VEGRNCSMNGLKVDVTEEWPQRTCGVNMRCARCLLHVDSVSGQTAYHVKRCSELHSGLC